MIVSPGDTFAGAYIGQDFSGHDFADNDNKIITATFTNCNFKGSMMPTVMQEAQFVNCDMRNAYRVTAAPIAGSVGSYGAKFTMCQFAGAVFTDLIATTFANCDLSSIELIGTLSGVTFNTCLLDNLRNAPFGSPATNIDCLFLGCRMRSATIVSGFADTDFTGIDLRGTKLSNNGGSTLLHNCTFTGADLRATVLIATSSKSDIRNCDFTGAYLNDTVLADDRVQASLKAQGCNFTNVDTKTVDPGYLAQNKIIVKDIISTLADRVGITSYPDAMINLVGLLDEVDGFVLTDQITFRSAIESLQAAFFFDVREINEQLQFISQVCQVPVVVDDDDLGAVRSGEPSIDKLTIIDADVYELPSQVNITFFDYAKDYATNTVYSRRMYHEQQTGDDQTMTLPMVLTPAQAVQIADNVLAMVWTQKTTYTCQTGNKLSALLPADVISAVVNGINRQIQITKKDYDGGLVKIEGREFRAPVLAPVPSVEPIPPPVIVPGPVTLYLFETSALTDADSAGMYAAATGTNYDPVMLYRSADAGNTDFDYIDTLQFAATAGSALTILADGPVDFFDRDNTVDVEVVAGTIASAPEIDVLNGANAALLGDEIIQFTTAELLADGKYRLSGLLRGRKGTEWATAGHTAGDRFILLQSDGSVVPESVSVNDIGRNFTYKFETVGTSNGKLVTFRSSGEGYRPRSVCHVSGIRDAPGNLTVSWIRRTRIGGAWRDYVDAPLGETAEQYTVEIVKTGAVIRTVSVTTPELVYTAAQQVADFGSVQAAVMVRIYQISSVIGRGHVKEVVV